MIRDKYRDKEHFINLVDSLTKSHDRRINKFKEDQIKPERVIPVKQAMATNLIQRMVAMYSLGAQPVELLLDFESILELIEESWLDGKRKLIGEKGKVLDQYVIDAHTQLLRIMSIAFLLNLEKSIFQSLANVIKKDAVIDLVFEFILSSRLENWEIRQEDESYAFELYGNLKKAISQNDNKDAEQFVKVFLGEDWLKEQKKSQMLIDPKKESYYGRWSFESAAVVAIKGLDDSSFRDNEYYPKDLVDYYRSNLKGLPS